MSRRRSTQRSGGAVNVLLLIAVVLLGSAVVAGSAGQTAFMVGLVLFVSARLSAGRRAYRPRRRRN